MDAAQNPNPTPQPTPPAVVPYDKEKDVAENKDMAALGYAWILSLVVFFSKKDSPFVKFHAKQGIVLFAISIAFLMLGTIGRYLELLVLAGIAYGFISAAQGLWTDVPVVGPLSRGEWKGVRDSWKTVVHRTGSFAAKKKAEQAQKQNTTPPTPPSTPPSPPSA